MPKKKSKNTSEPIMKDIDHIDIEKISRKNIYILPDNAFGEMQQQVLARVSEPSPKHSRKSVTTWWYAVAASIALIIGSTVLWQTEEDNAKPQRQTEAATTIAVDNTMTVDQTHELATVAIGKNPEVEKLTPDKIIENQENQSITKAEKQNTESKIVNAKMDESSLVELTPAEVQSVTMLDDQDIYLDLFTQN